MFLFIIFLTITLQNVYIFWRSFTKPNLLELVLIPSHKVA